MREMQEKKLDIGSSVKEGFGIIKDNPVIFALIVVYALISLALRLWLEVSYTENIEEYFLIDIFLIIFLILINIFLLNLIIRMVYDATQGEVSLSEGVKIASIKFLPVVGAGILFGLIVFLGIIALIIPGFFLGTKLIYFPNAILIDDEGVISSLKKSWRIVEGNWWRTYGLFFIFSIITEAILGISVLLSDLSVLAGFILIFVSYLFNGWMYSALVVAYLQLTR